MQPIAGMGTPKKDAPQTLDALERYYERRLEEIRRHAPLDEERFIPRDRLEELADGRSRWDGHTRRPGLDRMVAPPPSI
jgi:hypothetical protein